jgi:Zn-dependent protease
MGIIFSLAVLLFSVIIHEISHGVMAARLGDDTAKEAGRLTLNPLKHIDLFGSLLFPFMLWAANLPVVGWAKPVPYNPLRLFKDFKYGPLKVALAGPGSNLLVAAAFILFARLAVGVINPVTVGFFGYIAFLNIQLALFNLLPIPPLDGSKILTLILPRKYAYSLEAFGFAGIALVLIFVYFLSGILFEAANWVFVRVAGQEVVGATNLAIRGLFGA